MADLSAQARHLSSYEWVSDELGFGGYSGLTMSSNGARFTLLSDRSHIIEGTITRKDDRILGVRSKPLEWLDYSNDLLGENPERDTEGMAQDSSGAMYLSLETDNRIITRSANGEWSVLPTYDPILELPLNKGLEALAIDAQNTLFAIPETNGGLATEFPVFRYRQDMGWDTPHAISRVPGYQPVGADFDPMGRLYVLERGFAGFGFFSQVRRFTFKDGRLEAGDILLRSRTRQHDNLEGLAVWTVPDGGLRLTMVSDDNFMSIQKTEFVDYAVPK